MKISSFIVSLILVSTIVATFAFFYAGGSTAAGVTWDNTTFNAYDRMTDLENVTSDINDTISDFNPYNPADIIGGFLKGGYQVLQVTWTSFGIFTGMTEDSFDKVGSAVGGGGFSYLKTGLVMIAFVIFIFIIVSVFVGRDV